ncbi:MAG: ABC transporter permease [Anaerolineae bacterium]|nr:ABC transporter permease [Anaerolineae bacterium]
MIEWTARARRPLLRQPVTALALAWLVLLVLETLVLPPLLPTDPRFADPAQVLLPPAAGHVLGTDALGRDVLSRLVWGGRWTLGMAMAALVVTFVLGLPVGLAAGSLGGRVDALTMRVVDALLAFPALLLAMVVVAILGTGLLPVAVAVGITAAPAHARMVRSVALEIRSRPYIDAARSVGCPPLRIALRHILPNAAPVLIAFATTQLGWILINGAALNFLGLGAPLGTPEWGAMLAEGRGYLRDGPWISVFPGLALTLTVLAAHLVGNGIEEALKRD